MEFPSNKQSFSIYSSNDEIRSSWVEPNFHEKCNETFSLGMYKSDELWGTIVVILDPEHEYHSPLPMQNSKFNSFLWQF